MSRWKKFGISALVSLVISSLLAILPVHQLWENNNQGEAYDMTTGAIRYGYLTTIYGIGFLWAMIMTFPIVALVVFALWPAKRGY